MTKVFPAFTWVGRSGVRPPPAGVEDVLALLLTNRGVAESERTSFLHPVYDDALHDAALLPDFPVARDRLLRARDVGEHVAIFGDYDVDGVTASAVLLETLRQLGIAHVIVDLPHRVDDGYGLTDEVVQRLVPPATLLITVDNGTTAHDAIRRAHERGADVMVLDHHAVAATLPEHAWVVNPQRPESAYPFRGLSAVGLAFKMAQALLEETGRGGEEKWLLDLVALGTLADRAPLLGENRTLVHWGLRVLQESRRPGVRALASHARVPLAHCDADAVSFRLAPRLNAAGRLRHADLALRLLTTDDIREAQALATTLEETNGERKRVTEEIAGEIAERLLRAVPLPDVLCASGPWPVGVLGILASRFAEETGRPTVIMSTEGATCVASVRSVAGVNAVELLRNLGPLLTKFGGHAGAAGCSFPHAVRPQVEAYFAQCALPRSPRAAAQLSVDCVLPPALLHVDLAQSLRALEPHGEGNERPVFVIERLRVLDVRPVGATGDHLRFQLLLPSAHGPVLSAVAFRWRGRALPARRAEVDVASEVWLDRFRGRVGIELRLRDIRTPVTSDSLRERAPARSGEHTDPP